jgi:putative protease
MELVCPAGNLQSLKAAVDAGANSVYIGFRDETNARHFPGLNFNDRQISEGMEYAHGRGARVFIAINTHPQPGNLKKWQYAVDTAAAMHLSVQGSATSQDAIRFYTNEFGIKRAILPRVLSVRQVAAIVRKSPVPIETFGFGSLCVMVEGRCYLSSYVTGQGPNMYGACSPAKFVRWSETNEGKETRLNDVLIDRIADNENAGYPTICKGRYCVKGDVGYAIEEPTSLNTLPILGDLVEIGVAAIKIEGRQRSPAYVSRVTSVFREALDKCLADTKTYRPEKEWLATLAALSEGAQTTLGAYNRGWQ